MFRFFPWSFITNVLSTGSAVSQSPAHQESVASDVGVNGLPDDSRRRFTDIDLLRGVVMVLMALDHSRMFFCKAPFYPLDLNQTNASLFLTRWITHFCAPAFTFLAGAGAFLAAVRGKTKPQLARFLLTRGLWLMLLEFTWIHYGWFLNFKYDQVVGQIIWAIGGSMMALAGLIFLPTRLILILGVIIIAGHNLLDGVSRQSFGRFDWLFTILFSGGLVQLRPHMRLFVLYPIVPWLGVLLFGYGLGWVWLKDASRRRRWLLAVGAGCTLLFVALRAVNGYGDPHPWSKQSSALFSVFSFVKCEKYPPSLLFLLMTLGPAILLLAHRPGRFRALERLFVTFGRVPLFFYLVHLPLIHLLAQAWFSVGYKKVSSLAPNAELDRILTADYGLPVVYIACFLVLLILYPACYWFGRLKSRNRSGWLSYL